jgi:glutamate racemase
VAATRSKSVGVIGTRATIESQAYDDAFAAAPDVRLTTQACPRFVEFVERGETWSADLLEVAEDYLAPLKAAEVDTLVLGCTHYPLLTGVLAWVMGDEVTLVSSAEETAKDVFRALALRDAFRDSALPAPTHRFLSTGDPEPFQRLAHRFLGPEIGAVEAAPLADTPFAANGGA